VRLKVGRVLLTSHLKLGGWGFAIETESPDLANLTFVYNSEIPPIPYCERTILHPRTYAVDKDGA
jgi:hypothetical protein